MLVPFILAPLVVLLSSFIAFVELARDKNLYVYIGRYDTLGSSVICILPNGDYEL